MLGTFAWMLESLLCRVRKISLQSGYTCFNICKLQSAYVAIYKLHNTAVASNWVISPSLAALTTPAAACEVSEALCIEDRENEMG